MINSVMKGGNENGAKTAKGEEKVSGPVTRIRKKEEQNEIMRLVRE